jgi:AraC family transcriptional activator of pobA
MVNSGIIYLFNIFCAEKYHIASNFAPENNATHMKVDYLNNMQIAVCESPGGNGMRIDHMPDFLLRDDFDDTSPHIHYFYEILWFHEGTGRHTVDFHEYDVRPNTIFFLSPGLVHHFDRKTNYRGISIRMCTDFMKSENSTDNLFMKYNAFYTFDTTPCFHIDEETAAELLPLTVSMEEEINNNGLFGNIEILKSLLRIFLVKIQRHGVQEGESHLDILKPSHQLFLKFRRMVEQEYMHLHTVQEYADHLNVAVRTLNKCVNECSHTSPLAFINKRILLEGKRMVRYSNMMFKEIAYELGYEDPSYFVKMFKRHTGYLPSEFREMDHL